MFSASYFFILHDVKELFLGIFWYFSVNITTWLSAIYIAKLIG